MQRTGLNWPCKTIIDSPWKTLVIPGLTHTPITTCPVTWAQEIKHFLSVSLTKRGPPALCVHTTMRGHANTYTSLEYVHNLFFDYECIIKSQNILSQWQGSEWAGLQTRLNKKKLKHLIWDCTSCTFKFRGWVKFPEWCSVTTEPQKLVGVLQNHDTSFFFFFLKRLCS